MTGRTVEQLEQRVLELEAEVSSLRAALEGRPGAMAEAIRAARALAVQGIADQLRADGDARVGRVAGQARETRERAQAIDGALRTIADRLTLGRQVDGRAWDIDRVEADAIRIGRIRAAIGQLKVALFQGASPPGERSLIPAGRVLIAYHVLAGAPLEGAPDVEQG